MGVQNLWQLLESTAKPITLDALEGKRVAVDISLWLHQAAQGYSSHNVDAQSPHLSLLINRIAKLLFYKIRPVFVFDGDKVPVFKQQVLRNRAMKKHVEELTLEKNRKKIVEEAARDWTEGSDSREGFSRSPWKKAKRSGGTDEDDLFALPLASTKVNEAKAECASTPKGSAPSYDFLEGYEELVTPDARVQFLKDAKQRARDQRLQDDEIPEDSREFSNFQMQRLLKRNKINAQLDVLKKEKLEQCVRVSSDKLRMVVVDSHSRQHTLVKDDDVQIIDTEKAQREKVLRDSVTWPQFLKLMREDLAEETSAASVKPKQSEEDDGEDDALQEAILDSIAEQKGLRQRGTPAKSRRSLFDYDAGEEAERMNGYYEDAFSDLDGSDNDDDNDFEEVPELDDAAFPVHSSLSGKPAIPSTPPSATAAPSARKRVPGGFIPSDEGASADAIFVEDSDGEETAADYFARKRTAKPVALGPETERDSEGIYADCQQLLALLGLPYMVAPGEAEAQCARLEQLGIVDGCVTDDSDVWLFGGSCVYKDLFSRKRHVHEYNADTIQEKLGLDQKEFILIAMLAGGDYTDGFEKVGVTTALEIIAEFSTRSSDAEDALTVLGKIKQWLVSKKEYLEKAAKEGRKGNFIESATRIRLRKTIENNNGVARIDAFPIEDVYRAYAEPEVDCNEQRFKWTRVRFDDLYEYVWTKLGWSREKVEKQTHGAFKRWDNFMEQSVQQYQMRITAFTRPLGNANLAAEPNLEPTARVKAALERLAKKKGAASQASNSKAPSTSASAAKPDSGDDFYDEDVDLAMSQTLQMRPTSSKQHSTSGKSGKSLAVRKALARKKATPARRVSVKKTTKGRSLVRSKPQEEEELELNLSESSSNGSDDE